MGPVLRNRRLAGLTAGIASAALIGAGLLFGAAPANAATTTLYASPSGSGTTCSATSPCSITGAQTAVQGLVGSMNGDITVQLADGTYRLSSPMKFTGADSGTNGFTVRWAAASGAHPVISGAQRVTGWTQVDASKNIWAANVPTNLVTRELTVDGKLATRARLGINRSDVTVTDSGLTINNSTLQQTMDALAKPSQVELDALDSWTNRYSPVQSISGSAITMQQPAWDNNTFGWDTIQGAFRAGPMYFENAYEFLGTPGQWYDDPTTGKLYYVPVSGQSMSSADVELPTQQALVSVGGTLDSPTHDLAFTGITFTGNSWTAPSSNQGYADQQSGGYITGTWARPANAQSTCAAGCEDIEATRPHWDQLPAAVQVSAARSISFANDTFTGIGSDALGIGEDDNAVLTGVGLGASNISVTGSTFSQVAAGGITIGGIQANAHHPSDARMINQNFTITGNSVHDTGIDYRDSMGILATYTTNANISHNELYNLPYTALSVGYGWGTNDPGGSPDYQQRGLYNYQPIYTTPTTAKNNTVDNNNLHDFMQQMNDGGCFYTLSANPGSHFDYNHCNGNSNGMYYDEGSRYWTATNNVFENPAWWDSENGGPNNWTGDQTLIDNWTTNGTQHTARNDRITGLTFPGSNGWGCAARQVIAGAGPNPAAVNSASFDAVSAPYGTTSTTTSSFGQCRNQFGITTTGPSTSGQAAQDAAYAGITNAGAVTSGSTATVRVDSVAANGKAGLLVRNTASTRTATGFVTLTRTGSQVIAQWDGNGDGVLDASQTATVPASATTTLRLARSGTSFTASYSTDGSTWTALGAAFTVSSAATTQDAAVIASQTSGTSGTSQLSGLTIGKGAMATFATTPSNLVQKASGTVITSAGEDTWGVGQHDDSYTAQYLPGGAASSSTATVQVLTQQNSNTYAKAGLMIRNSIAGAGSSQGYAILAVTPGYGIVLESDKDGDGYLDTEAHVSVNTTTPMYLKLTRSGSTVTGQYSTDNSTWNNVGTATLSGAASTEDIGTFSLSHSAESNTASFGPLAVTPAASTSGALTAFTTNGGTASSSNGTVTITGKGADTWGGTPQHDDDYTAYYTPGGATTSSSATVQVLSQQNTNTYAKAGLMIRNSIAGAGASQGYAILAVTPGYGIVLESDSNGDGYLETESHVSINTTTPMHLRLARNGSTVTGQYSTDGTTWNNVGSATLSGAASTEDIGMFSLSHDVNTAGTSTFGSYKVTNG